MGSRKTTDRIRILLVEDDDEDAYLVRRALSESATLSFTVERASTLEEAQTLLKAGNYDAAVLDLTLPDSAGIDTVESVAQASAALPIVVVTDHRDQGIGLKAVRSGAQGFLSKAEAQGTALVRELGHAIERQQLHHELAKHRNNLEALVTERTQELREAVDRLEEHGRAKTEFIFNVSHELRTPLTSMIYTVENIVDGACGPITEKVRDYLTMLNDDCKRLKRTVEDILDITKIDTNRLVMHNAPIPATRQLLRSSSSRSRQADSRSSTLARCVRHSSAA